HPPDERLGGPPSAAPVVVADRQGEGDPALRPDQATSQHGRGENRRREGPVVPELLPPHPRGGLPAAGADRRQVGPLGGGELCTGHEHLPDMPQSCSRAACRPSWPAQDMGWPKGAHVVMIHPDQEAHVPGTSTMNRESLSKAQASKVHSKIGEMLGYLCKLR